MIHKNLQAIAKEVPVTSFMDYRDYLQELYKRAKATISPYSYLAFAEDLGFAGTNVLRLVIARKRKLAPKSAATIVRALDLRKEDRKFFLALVKHFNARGLGQRNEEFQKMLLAKQASVVSDADRKQMAFYSEWHHPVVREMLRLSKAPEGLEAMAAILYPSITLEKLRQSLALLESLGIIKVDRKSGKVRVINESPMVLPEDATAGELSISKYHQAMIDTAKEAVTKVPWSQREIDSMTLNLSLESFGELKRRITSFCAEVMALESSEQRHECVAQFNVQFFTLTKWS